MHVVLIGNYFITCGPVGLLLVASARNTLIIIQSSMMLLSGTRTIGIGTAIGFSH